MLPSDKISTLISKVSSIVSVVGLDKLPSWYEYKTTIEDMWINGKSVPVIMDKTQCMVNSEIVYIIGCSTTSKTTIYEYNKNTNIFTKKVDLPRNLSSFYCSFFDNALLAFT